MNKNRCEIENYHGAVFYDSLALPIDDAFKKFLQGNIEPLITKVNQEQYNHLYINPQSDLSLTLDNHHFENLVKFLSQVPSVKHLQLHANLTLAQANQIAHSLTDTNICSFNIRSLATQPSQSVQQYINALSDSKVTDFSLTYTTLDDATVESITFAGTTFTGLDLYDVQMTEYGFSKLIQNTYDSNIYDLFIDSDLILSSKAFEDIDFSKTSITRFELSSVGFQDDALAHVNLKNSQIEELYLYDNFLSSEDLGYLSKSLQDSNVKHLDIVQSYDNTLDLSKLALQETNVETLSLNGHFNYNGLENLNLTLTPVKTLDFSYGYLTDEHLQYLNLKNTNIEHLNLDYNNAITDYGINILREHIKDTHIIDVSIATYHYGAMFEPGINKPFVLNNEYVLPTDDSISQIIPKTMKETLALSDILVSSTLVSDELYVDAMQATSAKYIEPTVFTITQNPLGALEHDIVLLG